ncbi:MAG: hypothetical protein JNM24_19780 [Bdellovibrionaceae bacterium]|nr:hypothetical protein [Pseudobdellovibrionaceae bacterium]
MEKLPPSEIKAKTPEQTFKEMMPFVIYAAIPLAITIILALTFGPPY